MGPLDAHRAIRSSQESHCTPPFTIYCCNNQLTADRFPVLSWSGAVVCVNYSSSNNGTILGRTIVIGRTVVHTYDRPRPRKYRETIGSEMVVTAVYGEWGGAVPFLRTACVSKASKQQNEPKWTKYQQFKAFNVIELWLPLKVPTKKIEGRS